jgi:hypothetical protein
LAGVDCLDTSGAEELPPAAFARDALGAERGVELPVTDSEAPFIDVIVEAATGEDSDFGGADFVEPDAKAAA